MTTHTFKFAGVWKFKYVNSSGHPDVMITLDRTKAEMWAGQKDGQLIQLYEMETPCIARLLAAPTESLDKGGCAEAGTA